jgi:multidrug efflux system membrane fusion protein
MIPRFVRYGLLGLGPGLPPILARLSLGHGCAAKKAPRTPRVAVTTARVEQRDMPFSLSATGSVEALQTASVGSQVGGVVTRLSFHEGDVVREGQVLIQLDPRPFHQALDQALGALARDRAIAEAARNEVDRSRVLHDQNVLSQSEWEQKVSDADASAATVRADSASANNARLNLEYAAIRAPISGRSGRLMVHVGDYVKASTSDPLVTIIQPHPIRVSFKIPERDVPVLQRYRGQNPRVWVDPDSGRGPLQGRLVFVDNAIDPASGPASEGRIPEPGRPPGTGPVRGRASGALRGAAGDRGSVPGRVHGAAGLVRVRGQPGLDGDAAPDRGGAHGG